MSDPHTHLTGPISAFIYIYIYLFIYLLFIYLLIVLIINVLLNCVFMGYVYETLELFCLQVIEDWFLVCCFFFIILELDCK